MSRPVAISRPGFAFATGFFFVVLTGAVLFTEANVVLPATIVDRQVSAPAARLLRFWGLAWLGNFASAARSSPFCRSGTRCSHTGGEP